jgi:hypothetical protein
MDLRRRSFAAYDLFMQATCCLQIQCKRLQQQAYCSWVACRSRAQQSAVRRVPPPIPDIALPDRQPPSSNLAQSE